MLAGKISKVKKPTIDSDDLTNDIEAIKTEFSNISISLHDDDDDVKKLVRLKLYPEAYMKCYMQMEREVRNLLDYDFLRRGMTYVLTMDPLSRNFKPKERQSIIDYSRKRNKLAHGEDVDISNEDITEALRLNGIIINAVKKYLEATKA